MFIFLLIYIALSYGICWEIANKIGKESTPFERNVEYDPLPGLLFLLAPFSIFIILFYLILGKWIWMFSRWCGRYAAKFVK